MLLLNFDALGPGAVAPERREDGIRTEDDLRAGPCGLADRGFCDRALLDPVHRPEGAGRGNGRKTEAQSPGTHVFTVLGILEQVQQGNILQYIIVGAAVVLVLIVMVLLLRRGKRPVDPERGLAENLAGFPPAPGKPGKRRLTVHSQPMRLRLVVIAPMGKKPLPVDEAEGMLGSIQRGLDEIFKTDRPRVRVWPPQLSGTGFAQSFFRRVLRPEARGRMSNWVRAAGTAKAGATPILLGMALWADETTDIDELMLDGNEWLDVVRVVTE